MCGKTSRTRKVFACMGRQKVFLYMGDIPNYTENFENVGGRVYLDIWRLVWESDLRLRPTVTCTPGTQRLPYKRLTRELCHVAVWTSVRVYMHAKGPTRADQVHNNTSHEGHNAFHKHDLDLASVTYCMHKLQSKCPPSKSSNGCPSPCKQWPSQPQRSHPHTVVAHLTPRCKQRRRARAPNP